MSDKPAAPQYVLGRSDAESQRLIQQSNFMRPSTERVFHKAGITAGMRVLDLGCGVGDVSFLTAEIVGPNGSVVGIDLDPGVLAVARRRASENGFAQVTFEQGTIDSVTAPDPFDAAVGRFVLMYQADPVATLSHIAKIVKPGGLIVFQEPDFGVGVATWPTVALWQQVNHWIVETFRRGGVHYDIGGKLYHLFRRACLPGPALLEHVTVGGGPMMRPWCENSAGLVRSLLPRIEQFAIATPQEVQIESLADRLNLDTCAADAQITYVPIVGAWTAKG
jgi:2-polyprenyl-3-methyl-5-hydroxy-6-metoxy-1,4-benzoquinol methylase